MGLGGCRGAIDDDESDRAHGAYADRTYSAHTMVADKAGDLTLSGQAQRA